MKNTIYFTLLLLVTSIVNSCSTKCDCEELQPPMLQQYDLDKMVVETLTTNMSTGFESVFTSIISDSLEQAKLCQSIVPVATFFDDNSGYFFIETIDSAIVIAHVNTDLIGTSRINIQDDKGKYFIQDMVETVKYIGYGYVEYYRTNPTTNLDERKMSFVTSIPTPQWFIGAGFYGEPGTEYYTELEAAEILIEEATTTMAHTIDGANKNIYQNNYDITTFSQTFLDHIRFFDNGSGYFFINDFQGINIAHGADKEAQGRNDYDLQDTHGAYIIRDMIEIAQTVGAGYYEYYWINPVNESEELKTVYVKRIADTSWFIASGFYFY